MPATLKSFAELEARHLKRFAMVGRRMTKTVYDSGHDLMNVLTEIHTGTPIGKGRARALVQSDYPFARRHGSAMWPTPPIGIQSGRLAASLRVDYNRSVNTQVAGDFSVTARSVGVDYAKYIYAEDGTTKMVPRMAAQTVRQWAFVRVIAIGRDIMSYQLRLI